ncbi:MAG TPA: aldo/keto reductase [Chloroflexota bacterium]|nr:aldo/keto reductase [Chloroflexota bacterium]
MLRHRRLADGDWLLGDRRHRLGGGAADDESIRGIRKAIELGVTLFDTADAYSPGRSERVLGKPLAGRRHQVVVAATKFGHTPAGPNAEPGYIGSACEASLRRLNADYADLYQLHLGDRDPGAQRIDRSLDDNPQTYQDIS